MDFYFRYQSALYSKEDIQKLYYYLMRILFTAVEDPEITIGEMIERVYIKSFPERAAARSFFCLFPPISV